MVTATAREVNGEFCVTVTVGPVTRTVLLHAVRLAIGIMLLSVCPSIYDAVHCSS